MPRPCPLAPDQAQGHWSASTRPACAAGAEVGHLSMHRRDVKNHTSALPGTLSASLLTIG